MPTVSRLALPWGISLLSCSFLRELQAAFCESLAHTSRHRLLGQASPALLFHTITLESRGTPRGTPLFSSACQISLKSAPKDRGHQGAISKATVFMDVLESGMGSFVVARSQIWAFPTFLARPYLQKRIPTSPMQEAKQGAENFQPMRRQEGRSSTFLAVLRKTDWACTPCPLHICQPFALLKVRVEHQYLSPHVQGYPVPWLGRHRAVQAWVVCMGW